MRVMTGSGRLPWGTFVLLSTIFWFASRADLLYTVKDPPIAGVLIEGGRADDPLKAGALLLLVVWSIYTIWRDRRYPHQWNPLQVAALSLYSIWSAISILWTDDASLTTNKIMILAVTCLVSSAMAYRFSFRELAFLVFLGSFFTNALGLGAEIVLGTFRPWDGLYRFSGLWHPNAHGISLSLLVLAGLSLLQGEKRHRFLIASMTAVGFVLLLLTRSRTSVGATIVAAFVAWLLTLPVGRRWMILAVTSIVCCGSSFLVINDLFHMPTDTVSMGRDEVDEGTLTNRIPLWKECLPYIMQHPWIGFGYGGFWTASRVVTITEPSEAAYNPNYEKLVAPNSYLPDAHNLYIETTLGTGIIGAALLIGDLFLAIEWFGSKTARTGLASYSFAFSVLLWMSLESLLEAVSPQPFLPLLICPILLVKAACISDEPSNQQSTEPTFSEDELLSMPEPQHA